NIKVAGGHSETLNGRVGKRKTSVKEAASCEASTPFSDHSKKVAW
ncbi:MAG: transposase, partial [Microcystis aeruginosa LL13-03]|nr:transposase [Microcystis aeruginosa LL13-03]